MAAERPFWEKPLETLDRAEWEALCDGCGKCCLHKLQDEDTDEIYMTNVACRLLDLETAQCSNYRQRRIFVPDCIRLTAGKLDDFIWLPSTCAYVRRANGQPLPEWHYLLTGDRDSVHKAGMSVRGHAVSEVNAGPLENHIVSES